MELSSSRLSVAASSPERVGLRLTVQTALEHAGVGAVHAPPHATRCHRRTRAASRSPRPPPRAQPRRCRRARRAPCVARAWSSASRYTSGLNTGSTPRRRSRASAKRAGRAGAPWRCPPSGRPATGRRRTARRRAARRRPWRADAARSTRAGGRSLRGRASSTARSASGRDRRMRPRPATPAIRSPESGPRGSLERTVSGLRIVPARVAATDFASAATAPRPLRSPARPRAPAVPRRPPRAGAGRTGCARGGRLRSRRRAPVRHPSRRAPARCRRGRTCSRPRRRGASRSSAPSAPPVPRPAARPAAASSTTSASARGRSWPSDIATSPVPGGMSTSERVQLAPVDVGEELLERLVQHRPAPHDRRVLLEEEPDRHELEVAANGRHDHLVDGDRLLVDAEHVRDRVPVDVAVEDADLLAERRRARTRGWP